MYRAVTIPHATRLNAMLAKNKNCGSMKFFFLGENSSHSGNDRFRDGVQSRVKTANSTPRRFSRRLRARLAVMAGKSGPITKPRFGPL